MENRSILETTLNTRDLGGYTSILTGKPLRTWQLLRSDVPNYPSDRDTALLLSHGIRTILDLRGPKDTARKPSGFADMDGFYYRNIPIEEGSGIPESPDAVSKSYLAIAESRNMAQVFRAIAAAPDGVMFNCTAGKDRTGVVSAVLLGLCGVSEDTILLDYMRTKECSRERFALIHQNFPEIDMTIVIPHARYMTEFLGMLHSKYGSYRGYLSAIGITDSEMEWILKKIL